MNCNRDSAGASRRRSLAAPRTVAQRARLGLLLLAGALLGFPALAADMNKVIRYAFPAAETGFDPAGAQDLYSGTIEQAIFETLLTYDYLARPAHLVPLTAEAMPQVSADGKVYTFKIRKGIYYSPDPAFKGKKRELTAEDYAYSLKRLIDPKLASPWAWWPTVRRCHGPAHARPTPCPPSTSLCASSRARSGSAKRDSPRGRGRAEAGQHRQRTHASQSPSG